MEIRNISEKIFRTSPNKIEDRKCNQTNPFGVSFNGKVVKADVFESAAKKSIIVERVSNRSKMVMSTIVGSVNSMNHAISSRLDSMVSFGKRIGESATRAWSNMNPANLRSRMENWGSQSREILQNKLLDRSYKNRSVEDLSSMFENAIRERTRAEEVIA